jgi:hypothetical protein
MPNGRLFRDPRLSYTNLIDSNRLSADKSGTPAPLSSSSRLSIPSKHSNWMDVRVVVQCTQIKRIERERRMDTHIIRVYGSYTSILYVNTKFWPAGYNWKGADEIQLTTRRRFPKSCITRRTRQHDAYTQLAYISLFCMSNRNWWLGSCRREEEKKKKKKKRERNDGCTLNYKSITQFAFHYFESHFGIKPTFPGLYTVFGMLLKPGQNGGKKKTSIHPSIPPPVQPFLTRKPPNGWLHSIQHSLFFPPSSYSN